MLGVCVWLGEESYLFCFPKRKEGKGEGKGKEGYSGLDTADKEL